MDAFVSVIWMTIVLLMFIISWDCTFIGACRRDREGTIKALLNSSIYDNRIPPDFEEDYATEVTIQLFVLSFDTVTEASMVTNAESQSGDLPYSSRAQGAQSTRTSSRPSFDYSVTIFLREHWVDRRLVWGDANLASGSGQSCTNNSTSKDSTISTPFFTSGDAATGGTNEDDNDDDVEILERLEVGTKMMDEIWMPDLYFVNDKEANIHDVTMANRMLHIYRNGTISTSTRISMTLSCDMYLERYPHDEQTCSIFIGSYSYSKENVDFKWHETPVIIRQGVTLPRFEVEFGGKGDCNFQFDQGSLIVGNFTCIRADFSLVRQFGYYIAQVYVPSVLIVMLSWVSFWIDLEAIPARVSLGLLTVLTMTTQSTGEKSSLPKVSYLKAIDVWMAGCLVFVFAALLEFAYVNVQSRVEKRRSVSFSGPRSPSPADTVTKIATDVVHSANGGSTPSDSNPGPKIFGERQTEVTLTRRTRFIRDLNGVQRARMADKISRVVFPLSFIIFNTIYWVAYNSRW